MLPILKTILDSGVVTSEAGEEFKLFANVPLEQGLFLQGIISEIKATVSLEVGLAYGVSALFICEALEKTDHTRHVVIDPHQMEYFKDIGLKHLKEAGYESITEFSDLPSHRALAKLEDEKRIFDFAFIDGWHTFDHALVDFFLIDKLLRVGGVLVMDDTNHEPVYRVSQFIARNRAYSLLRTFPQMNTADIFRGHLGTIKQRVLKELRIPSPDPHSGGANILQAPRCIAFRKDGEDTREWNFYRSF